MMHPDRFELVLIGIGNEFRKDDGAGITLIRRLQITPIPRVRYLEHCGEGLELLELWKDAKAAICVDAVSSGSNPGTIFRFAIPQQVLPKDLFPCSTHALGIFDTIELGKTLQRLPEQLVIYGVEGQSFESGVGLTPAVRSVVEELAHMIQHEVEEFLHA